MEKQWSIEITQPKPNPAAPPQRNNQNKRGAFTAVLGPDLDYRTSALEFHLILVIFGFVFPGTPDFLMNTRQSKWLLKG